MTGSRGYACADGPLAGTILMLDVEPEPGSLWMVADQHGTTHVYQYKHHHFDYAGPDPHLEVQPPN
jgi:hypothetical protein